MRDIFTLALHAIVTIIRLGQPGGLRSVVAESVLMRHQVLILNRGRKRAPVLGEFLKSRGDRRLIEQPVETGCV
jgi:hypothetical protein